MKFYNPFDIALDSVSLFFCLVVVVVTVGAAAITIIVNYVSISTAALILFAGIIARILYAVFKGK